MSSQEPNADLLPDELAMSFLKDSEKGLHRSFFKGFFIGNPEDDAPGMDVLPAMFFTKTNSSYKQGATNTDEVTHTILIRAIVSRREFVNAGAWDEAYDLKKLQLMIEGTVNGVLDPNSVLGILRKNFTMKNYVFDNEITTNYGGVRDIFANEVTREAQIQITVTRNQESFKV